MTALLALAWIPAAAQEFYYKEVLRDGTIYVFTDAARAKRFEQTGELSVEITRTGAGPHRERVIADSAGALALYLFRHDLPPPPSTPADPNAPADQFSFLLFGDYYYFANHHESGWGGQQGFWVRRAYFTYDHRFSSNLWARFRLEANSNGTLEGGALTPYVKDAAMRWMYAGRQKMTVGIQVTPVPDFVDQFWGLRHIEKTPFDLYKWDSSRDFAIQSSGPLTRDGKSTYTVQFGNDSGSDSEVDTQKAVRVALAHETPTGWSWHVYASRFNHAEHADWRTLELFAGYRTRKTRVGAQFGYQTRLGGETGASPDVTQRFLSLFAVTDPRQQALSLFARVDIYADPCPQCAGISYLPIDPNQKFVLTVAGAEIYIHPRVRVSPNIEWITYGTPAGAGATAPRSDVCLRTTFFWSW